MVIVKLDKASSKSCEFKKGDAVVYPSHGVGMVVDEEVQSVSGTEISCYVIVFEKDKMKLRVPKNKAEKTGLRHLSSNADISKALGTIKGKARVEKGMWSKRAQKYEEKINSGNVVYIAEVVRDLHRNVDNPNCSYSERQIFDSAFQRFVNEYAASQGIAVNDAQNKIKSILDEAKAELQDEAA